MHTQRPSNRVSSRAFTLIELLVVISIIAVLVATFLPALSKARDQALNLKCLASSRGVLGACANYAADNRDFIVRPDASLNLNYAGVLDHLQYASRDIFTNKGCPYGPPDGIYLFWNTSDDYYSAPDSTNGPYYQYISYGLNGVLQSNFGQDFTAPTTTYNFWPTPFTFHSKRMLYDPSHAAVVTCCVVPWTNGTQAVWPALHHTLAEYSAYNPDCKAPPRHQGKGLPMAMADGHSEMVPAADVLAAPYSLWGPPGSIMASFAMRGWYGGVANFD